MVLVIQGGAEQPTPSIARQLNLRPGAVFKQAIGHIDSFAEVESAYVEELLESHCEDLPAADQQQLVAAVEIEDAEDDEVQDAKPRELPTSVLSSILREVVKQLQLLEDNDYNAGKSRIAVHGVKSFLAPYEQLLCERRKTAKQQTLDVLFKSTPKKQSEDTEPQPSTSGIRRPCEEEEQDDIDEVVGNPSRYKMVHLRHHFLPMSRFMVLLYSP
ncbi:putative Tigger transposable element-derived protein 1-like 333 [Homarus americanus]|uniref:Putative Tigger transposable element-derived protein 1-like 333 n=1 Tax=Homarus americanus TaxID=6706 RepID=A0A8J5TND1_HOMAM|nr:putative Tigger transposable element-derived protein 1-like 333 [Homarus americanus]